jgi:hypothetical protein
MGIGNSDTTETTIDDNTEKVVLKETPTLHGVLRFD